MGIGQTQGLTYKIIQKDKEKTKTIKEWTIEQDDINRARQEFAVFNLDIPDRGEFRDLTV